MVPTVTNFYIVININVINLFFRSGRETYGDNAVGYVEVKRDKNICLVRGKITPEHSVKKKVFLYIDTPLPLLFLKIVFLRNYRK